MMMMALNPDVQKKVQDELDDVVGVSRLPLLADRPYLPYLAAVIKESMRYHPVVPLSK
jgi:cytochrome P450